MKKPPSVRKGEKDTTPQSTPRNSKAKAGKAPAKATGSIGKKSGLESVIEEPVASPTTKTKEPASTVDADGKKIEYLTKELLARQPLDEKSRNALAKKAGPPKQEVNFVRNENHRPVGRADGLTPSRHERVPPSHIVLMFNCFEASFSLIAGDIGTMPESDTLDLRSLTSGKVLGRIKITPEKGETPAAPRAGSMLLSRPFLPLPLPPGRPTDVCAAEAAVRRVSLALGRGARLWHWGGAAGGGGGGSGVALATGRRVVTWGGVGMG